MARDFAKLLTRVWKDEDWLSLSAIEQTVYISLLTTDDLSWCGVAPLLPQRLAGFASDLSVAKARKALDVLTEKRFVVADEDAGEVAVRSFVRNDKVVSQPNITRAMLKAFDLVRSERIASVITQELARSYAEEPDLKGWVTVKSVAPDLFDIISKGSPKGSAKGSPDPSPMGSGKAS